MDSGAGKLNARHGADVGKFHVLAKQYVCRWMLTVYDPAIVRETCGWWLRGVDYTFLRQAQSTVHKQIPCRDVASNEQVCTGYIKIAKRRKRRKYERTKYTG